MNRWILIVVGLLAGNALAVVILIASAGSADGGRVLPDYYTRAARYDVELAAANASARIGWTVDAAMTGGAIAVRIADASGAPVSGADVAIEAYHRAHAATRVTLALRETAAGVYGAAIPGARSGWWDVTIRSRRHPDSHVASRAIEAVP
jgi:nitrogen fixation protein FixH